jgi:hypothetical protein
MSSPPAGQAWLASAGKRHGTVKFCGSRSRFQELGGRADQWVGCRQQSATSDDVMEGSMMTLSIAQYTVTAVVVVSVVIAVVRFELLCVACSVAATNLRKIDA